jgi:hypothetical protein
MLAGARKKCTRTEFHEADITVDSRTLPGPYDLITAFRFFPRADPQLRSDAMAAISARLRPGGRLIVNLYENPLALGALLRRLTGVRTESDLTHIGFGRLLRQHGLRVERRIGIATWMILVRWHNWRVVEGADRKLERLSAPLGFISPDAVVVARKD